MQQAQELVARAATAEESIRQAKAAAENVIRAFYEEVGWEVTVIWVAGPADRP
jgi:Flp pilus assembly protein TadG